MGKAIYCGQTVSNFADAVIVLVMWNNFPIVLLHVSVFFWVLFELFWKFIITVNQLTNQQNFTERPTPLIGPMYAIYEGRYITSRFLSHFLHRNTINS